MNDCRNHGNKISITSEGSAQLKKSMQDRNKKICKTILRFSFTPRVLVSITVHYLCYSLNLAKTRMHSSRMRTARSSSRPGGGGSPPAPREQTPPWEQTPPSPQDQPPPPPLTESQTPVKILPCPNFVAGGNNPGFPGYSNLSTVKMTDTCMFD